VCFFFQFPHVLIHIK
ncbi:subfamily C1A unassigned peptidase (C01 family), partial [Schistosoma mansoni]